MNEIKGSHKKVETFIALLAVAVVIMFFGLFPQMTSIMKHNGALSGMPMEPVPPPPPGTFDGLVPPPPPPPPVGSGNDSWGSYSDTIMAKHSFSNGVHKLSGTINLPTPCHSLSNEVFVAESYPEQVHVAFTIKNPGGDTMCAQVIEPRKFTITYSASEQATLSVTVNNHPASIVIEE